MKAIIEFDLPDDNDQYELANNALKWYSVCFDIKQEIRKNLKYNDKLTEEEYKIYEQLYDKLHELLNDNGLSL